MSDDNDPCPTEPGAWHSTPTLRTDRHGTLWSIRTGTDIHGDLYIEATNLGPVEDAVDRIPVRQLFEYAEHLAHRRDALRADPARLDEMEYRAAKGFD